MPKPGVAIGAPKGNKNAFQRGWTINDEGYRRITAGKDRHKYEHRVVIERLLENPISYVLPRKIPENWTVDHIDHSKRHNCYQNLLLLERSIHGFISEQHRRFVAKHFQEVWDNSKEDLRWE